MVGGFCSEGKLDDLLTKKHLYSEFLLETIDQITNVPWLCLSLCAEQCFAYFHLGC